MAKSSKFDLKGNLLIAVWILILIGVIYTAVITINFMNSISNTISRSPSPPSAMESVNILIMGMDIGDVHDKDNEGIKRSDSLMLLNYNPSTKRANLISIPRDMLIKVRSSKGVGKNAKINSAYSLGGDELLVSYVEEFTRSKVNYLVKIDYDGFSSIIDAIGGINMEMKYDMNYDDDAQDLHIHFKKGKSYHLDGNQAEAFFRWRKNNDGTGLESGDLGRIENQHEFIKKVIDRFKSPTIIVKIPKLFKIIPQYVKTNMSATEMVSIAWKIVNAKDGIKMDTIKGNPKKIDGIDYLVYDKEKNADIISTLKGELKVSEREKDEFKLMILNGTGINGLAGKVQAEMDLRGWTNIETGNIDTIEKSSLMVKYDELKDVLKKESNISNVENFDMEKYLEYDAVIILGKDYKDRSE